MVPYRHRHPSFWTPQRVPAWPLEVDWSHPLSEGLISCYFPKGNVFIDVAKGGPDLVSFGGSASNAVSFAGPNGPGILASGSGSALWAPASPAQQVPSGSSVSLFWAGVFGAAQSSNGASYLIGVQPNDTGASPYNSYSLTANGTSKSLLAASSSGSSPSANLPSWASTAGGVFSANDNSITLYENGSPAGTTAIGGTSFSYTGTPQVGIGGIPAAALSGRFSGAATSIALIYGRALSPGEMARLNYAPFDILRPKVKRLFVKAVIAPFAGSAPAVSSASGSLSTAILLAGACAPQTAASASITTEIWLGGEILGASAASGALTTSISLAGAASAQAGSSGALSTAIRFAAAAAGVASGSGALSTETRLAGTASARAAASGELGGEAAQFSSTANATASASGVLSTAIYLTGVALTASAASGTLDTAAVRLGGRAAVAAAASGILVTSISLESSAEGRASASGALLSPRIVLTGAALATGAAAGSLSTSIVFSGTALAQASVSAAMRNVSSPGVYPPWSASSLPAQPAVSPGDGSRMSRVATTSRRSGVTPTLRSA